MAAPTRRVGAEPDSPHWSDKSTPLFVSSLSMTASTLCRETGEGAPARTPFATGSVVKWSSGVAQEGVAPMGPNGQPHAGRTAPVPVDIVLVGDTGSGDGCGDYIARQRRQFALMARRELQSSPATA